MKTVVGWVMVAAGIVLGLYTGIWLCFIGGICDITHQVQAEHIEATGLAIGIAKITFSALAGWISTVILVVPGLVISRG